MRRLSPDEIKSIELEMLHYVHRVCRDNNIRYTLSGGTLLGAIRHNGFIPWDDDIDISLPRPDYMRLVELLKDGDRYRTMSMYHDTAYPYSFAKVIDTNTVLYERNIDYTVEGLGVYIDLFPYDGLPSDEDERKRYYKKIMRQRQKLYLSLYEKCTESTNRFKWTVKYVYWRYSRLRGWRHWLESVEDLTRRYDYDTSDYFGCQSSGCAGEREVFSKGAFAKSVLHTFEDGEFYIPIGYDEYLTKVYGDYMTPPPENERLSGHDMEAYLK